MTADPTLDRKTARAAIEAAGITYAQVKAWAVASGRWDAAEVAALNVDATEAYLREHGHG